MQRKYIRRRDFAEDSGYWINVIAAGYYGVSSISGVTMEELTEY